jgi:DNA-binding phage protein
MPPGSDKRLQPALLQSILDHIAAGENNSEIARATGITRKCIGKLQVSLEY